MELEIVEIRWQIIWPIQLMIKVQFFWKGHKNLKNLPPVLSKQVGDFFKGPGAKNDTSENPGSFNQILSFESQKGSPVATF